MQENAETITRHDLEAKIVKRCWEDEAFYKELTSDPPGTFAKYLNVPATSLPKIFVHQEEPGSWHIVLPEKTCERRRALGIGPRKDLRGVNPGMCRVVGNCRYLRSLVYIGCCDCNRRRVVTPVL